MHMDAIRKLWDDEIRELRKKKRVPDDVADEDIPHEDVAAEVLQAILHALVEEATARSFSVEDVGTMMVKALCAEGYQDGQDHGFDLATEENKADED
jgi:hypothetical protein